MGLKEEKKTGSTATKDELTQVTASDIEKAHQEDVENKKVDDATKAVEQRFNPISHEQGVMNEAVTGDEPEVETNDEEPDLSTPYQEQEGDSATTVDPMTGQATTVGELRRLQPSRNNN